MNNQGETNMEQAANREKLPAPVYYVTSETDDTVLVGINVVRSGQVISWHDTTKERVMIAETIISNDPNDFQFQTPADSGANTYRFTPLDLATYRLSVKSHIASAPDFADDAAMIRAFEEAYKNEW